jgi:capsular exopolysaccharide synthesis family protein
MSRIHEALKKAEQERAAAGQGGQAELTPLRETRIPDPIPAAVLERPVPEQPAEARAASLHDAARGALSEDMLLSRTVQREWKPDLKTMLFFGAEESNQGTEQFRTLRARLYGLRERLPLKTILVGSALPKDGKSFVAANLSQVLARQQGRRVLLIDGDMRLSSLHSALGTTSTPGLGDYLLGETDELSVIQRSPMENLFFLPSGRTVEHPAELISNGRLRLLLERVDPLFEWVIIDSPPAVPVSDASQLAQYADGVLLVVRSNATPYDTAQRAQREFQGKALVGVVLNGMMRGGSYSRYVYETYERPVGQKV